MSNPIVTLAEPIRIETGIDHVRLRVNLSVGNRGKLINELSKALSERVAGALMEEQVKRAPHMLDACTKREVLEALRTFFKEATSLQLGGTVEDMLWALVAYKTKGQPDAQYWECLIHFVQAANQMEAFELLECAYARYWTGMIHGAPDTIVFRLDRKTGRIGFLPLVPIDQLGATVFGSEKEMAEAQRDLRKGMSRPLIGTSVPPKGQMH
jgi:hypothetical protein